MHLKHACLPIPPPEHSPEIYHGMCVLCNSKIFWKKLQFDGLFEKYTWSTSVIITGTPVVYGGMCMCVHYCAHEKTLPVYTFIINLTENFLENQTLNQSTTASYLWQKNRPPTSLPGAGCQTWTDDRPLTRRVLCRWAKPAWYPTGDSNPEPID